MESGEIIASINQVYGRFSLKDNLRLHMLKVAGVGDAIVANWSSPAIEINGKDIVATLLIHDIGNVVKFNFDDPKFWAGQSAHEIEYWKAMKRDTIERYGSSSDKEVTLGMARELGINERLLFLLSNMSFGQVRAALASDDFDLKICMYADQRVGPPGVVSVAERFRDLRQRYGKGDDWKEEVGLKLEDQIFKNVRIKPSDITEESVKGFVSKHQRVKQRP